MMIKNSVFCVVGAALVMIAVPGGVSHAEPNSPTSATPAVLLPHADPRPIPDIDSYHVVTDTKQYEVHDKDGQLMGMQFSTPDGALCGLNIDVVSESMEHDPANSGVSSCISDKFPLVKPFDPKVAAPGDGKPIAESVYVSNVYANKGYSVTLENVLHDPGLATTTSGRALVDGWNRLRGVLAAADAGRTPPGFPVLPAGSILGFTPNWLYVVSDNMSLFPVACAVGFNHVVWCASHTLVELKYGGQKGDSQTISSDEIQPKGFYVSPKKAVYYNGYYDEGTVMADYKNS